MKINFGKLVPGKAELLFCVFLAVSIGLLSNTKLLLDTQGLGSTVTTISESAGQTIGQSLAKLDTYQLTNTVVTFAVWALIGLLTLSIIQGFGHVLYEFNERNQL